MIDKLMTPQEASEKLRVSLPQIYLMARNGDLPFVHIGRLIRFREIDLENFVQENLNQKNKNQVFCGHSKPGNHKMPSLNKEQFHVKL